MGPDSDAKGRGSNPTERGSNAMGRGSSPMGQGSSLAAEETEALRSLGYVSTGAKSKRGEQAQKAQRPSGAGNETGTAASVQASTHARDAVNARTLEPKELDKKIGSDASGVRRKDLPRVVPNEGLARMTFTRLTWFRADGTRIVVEADGQVWKVGPRDRTLLRALPYGEIERLRRALAAARPQAWSTAGTAGTARAKLVLETLSGRFEAALPASDPALRNLIGLLAERKK